LVVILQSNCYGLVVCRCRKHLLTHFAELVVAESDEFVVEILTLSVVVLEI